jgi:hypothetical protein
VWCASNRNDALTRAKNGENLNSPKCPQALVTVVAGRPHLFAPASLGFCFWLETRSYGRGEREADERVTRESLDGPPSFWTLPANLGGFFLPAPAVGGGESRLTGGTVTVLRQGPCEGDG